MLNKRTLAAGAAGVAMACAMLATPALAQSTGSLDFDNSIVVTGKTDKGIGGIQIPDSPKAKQVLTQAVIARGTPGQSIDDTINLIPGVSFQNYDGYGSSGGNLMIRGFDGSRISQTFDGIPLNDTGNYALYSGEQLDPELIEQVNVNLGTTDVDSPTASASGSTVNYRSVDPTHEFGARMVGTMGSYNKLRLFGMINTGDLNATGTRAWFSASKDTYDAVYGGVGKMNKEQFNGKIYQPLGDNGDFISLAGHLDINHNNFTSDFALSNAASVGLPTSAKEARDYTVPRCTAAAGVDGETDTATTCGTAWEYRWNPSKTANIRMNSKFTLNDKMVLTVDPYYSYTTANGGGTVKAQEGGYNAGTATDPNYIAGYIGGTPYFNGVDLNGDGDTKDQVLLAAPSQTVTNRIGVIASLRYDISTNQHVRVAYSYDRGKVRQTGELCTMNSNGFASDYYCNGSNALTDVSGNVLEKRDRTTYSILHQVSGEYSGDFVDNRLHLVAGVRVPFFRRNLQQNCLTTNVSGSVTCFSSDSADQATYIAALEAAGTDYVAPGHKEYTYSKVLPNVGFTFDITQALQLNANYSKGMQVPSSDNLYTNGYWTNDNYNSPTPETTNNFDLGLRYTTGILQASVDGWYTIFQNRLSTAYDPGSDTSVYTNLGRVDRYGIDGTLAVKPSSHVMAYVFGSYLWSKIKEDVQTGTDTYADTKGNMEGGVPSYTFGGRVEGNLGPVSLGVQAKRTGSRYYNSLNSAVYSGTTEIFAAKVPGYTTVDLDARLNLGFTGMGDKTYLQFNVTNLFNKFYYGAFSDAGVSNTTTTYAYLGAPRTISGSINFQF
ncbi:TonB-dependent receptor [Novosphingobium sp. 9]|uniref:TonB-dependent receptor n=1 Tax=Novosphingobium sp. 9 TaxID=2025349 RepID=UPI0021B5058B|nr:TonB-dependent receptor [Novosphingobium sp. 9]